MIIQKFTSMLYSLNKILSKETSTEHDFQMWFENNPEIFRLLNYSEYIPHPEIISTKTENKYIPDFLAKRLTGIWEIFELKKHNTKILKPKGRRVTFYSEFETYVSQCREYSELCETETNINILKDKYNVCIQKPIPSTMIAGQDFYVKKSQVHKLLSDRVSKVQLLTYDDIKNTIISSIRLHDSYLKNLPGITLSLVCELIPNDLIKQQYFYDFGIELQKDRISIGIENQKKIFIRVFASNGKMHETTFLMTNEEIDLFKKFHLHAEIGFSDESLYLTIFINGRLFKHNKLDKCKIKTEVFYYWVIGSDINAKENSSMSLYESLIYCRTLSFFEREKIFKFINCIYFNKNNKDTLNKVTFEGLKFYHIKDHPNFTPNKASVNSLPKSQGPWAWYSLNQHLIKKTKLEIPSQEYTLFHK